MKCLMWPFCECLGLLFFLRSQPCAHHWSNIKSPRQSLWSRRREWTPEGSLPWIHEYQNLLSGRPKGMCLFLNIYIYSSICTHYKYIGFLGAYRFCHSGTELKHGMSHLSSLDLGVQIWKHILLFYYMPITLKVISVMLKLLMWPT